MLKSLLFWIHVSESNKDRGEESWRGLLKSESAPTKLRGRVCVRTSLSLGVWLLLEDVVDQDLKEDEKNDDDVVTLLEEGAALHPARCTTPQHGDGPANTQMLRVSAERSSVLPQSPHSVTYTSHLLMSSCVCFMDSMAL